jgi:hypothetical protein
MEQLRERLDKCENNSMPDKDKLLSSLNVQISEVQFNTKLRIDKDQVLNIFLF